MTKEQAIKLGKELNKKIKTYKGDWYTINSILGNDWARFFYLLGGREAGKSYSVMRWSTTRKLRNPDKVKFYWFRLTEASQKKLLNNNAAAFVDADIARRFDLQLTVKRKSGI